jgi:hypothetical protein
MIKTRTTHQTVTFARSFVLSGLDGTQPAGTYTIETDEEHLEAMSFPAYRRLETRMRLRGGSGAAGFEEVARIDAADLDDALAREAVGDLDAAAAVGERAPVPGSSVTVPTLTAWAGQTRLEPAGPFAVMMTSAAAASTGPRAHPVPGGWLSFNLADLKLIALLLGGMCVFGILMSFDLPLVRDALGP